MRTGRPTTVVTELLSTLAGHSRTTVISFHPKIALWTLLELGSLHEFYEILVVLVKSIADFVLSTTHTFVVETSTAETIVLGTSRALVVGESFIRLESSRTPSSRTPSCLLVFFYKFVKGKLLKLFF